MTRIPTPILAFACATGGLLVPAASAQVSGSGPGGDPARQAPLPAGAGPDGGPRVGREEMWYAPTAEDWKKPVLITWQRTYADALAVSQATGKPILVCVNMDGEIASEHYAGVRYREPEKARLYEPYVCVIASVYRHTPRDYDEEGRRIPCPRFGTVTCGEHIAIEPGLFDKFMDDKRIAPRHIAIEPTKQEAETFDVYYAWDTDSVFGAIRKAIEERPAPPPPPTIDRRIEERVASRDVVDRMATEAAYRDGQRDERRALLAAAIAAGDPPPVDLLRLAVFGLDRDAAKLAREALARTNSETAVDLIAEALRAPLEANEREALVASLGRIGATSPRARTLFAVYEGLAGKTTTVDLDAWSKALSGAVAPAPIVERYTIESQLELQVEAAQRSSAQVDDRGAARLALAESYLELAADSKTSRRYAKVLYEDARSTALAAEAAGSKGWRADATLALANAALGDADESLRRAEAAVAAMPPESNGWQSMAVLALFADARQQAISKAMRAKQDWPPQWLSDVHAAYAVLARHPFGTDAQVVSHYDFLRFLGAAGQAANVLDAGLARFPDSWVLHDRFRTRVLNERGVEGLESAYAAQLARADAPPNLPSYAGYAELVAAEFHRRASRDDLARAAYDRGIALYERWIAASPDNRNAGDHYIALALAGKARMDLVHGDLDAALQGILASFERKPESAANPDGLNLSPVDTAKTLLAKLRSEKRDDAVQRLDAALASLDPRLLELPAYERAIPGGPSFRGGRGRGPGGNPGGERGAGRDETPPLPATPPQSGAPKR
ncbi:MAG: hypothetical protein NTY35_13060 [Planctomycetota bacterium]|nr:hypothetical protein [Planctomycetota bacterium]